MIPPNQHGNGKSEGNDTSIPQVGSLKKTTQVEDGGRGAVHSDWHVTGLGDDTAELSSIA